MYVAVSQGRSSAWHTYSVVVARGARARGSVAQPTMRLAKASRIEASHSGDQPGQAEADVDELIT